MYLFLFYFYVFILIKLFDLLILTHSHNVLDTICICRFCVQ
jgi:hypothetical protein